MPKTGLKFTHVEAYVLNSPTGTPPQVLCTPGLATWRHRSGSILAQVMAWCLTATSHYLNQCWLNVSEVLWQWIIQTKLAWWRHQMETFSASLALHEGNPLVTVDSLHKGQWQALMFSFIYAWTNAWANNRNAGDLRRHCAHYDINIMGAAAQTAGPTLIPWSWWCQNCRDWRHRRFLQIQI